ncbi:MAG: hypothetical protein ACLSG9_11005 [Eubacterium sp.]
MYMHKLSDGRQREEVNGQSMSSEPAEIWSDKEEEMIKNRVGSLLEEKQFETVEQAKRSDESSLQ